ncbi:hypothetical protein L2750_15380 [Shewanella submarina]|uniref:Uncharacterized protein n=1 Tax=Shewanella submarina TaxID=2016376 RepID=A0ABV7GCS6_9GAMM|nr:hypothetical protein [Shewanella submarina]MCL1038515.1 hypothetical protein [Shewanella submarina]
MLKPLLLVLLSAISHISIAIDFDKEIYLEEYQTSRISLADGSHWQYQTHYQLPINLDSVEQYARNHGLEITIQERTFSNSGGGGGCGHSPVCVILLPVYLLDMLSADEVTLDQVSFFRDGQWVMDLLYDKSGGHLARIKSDTLSIASSKLLTKTVIDSTDKAPLALSGELITLLPQLHSQAELSQFNTEISKFRSQLVHSQQKQAQQKQAIALLKTTKLTVPQFMPLAEHWCSLNDSLMNYDLSSSPQQLLEYTAAISRGDQATKILDCVIQHPAIDNWGELDRLINLQERALTEWESYQAYEWHNQVRDFFTDYFPHKSTAALTQAHPLLSIYQRWYQSAEISSSDYIKLATEYQEISAPLRKELTISTPNVLNARLTLASQGKYPPLPTLKQIHRAAPTINSEQARALAELYWQNNYDIERFAILPRQDKDFEKQAYILSLLVPLPDDVRRTLPMPQGDTDAHMAWRIAILNQEVEGLAELLALRPALDDRSPEAPETVSTRVDEQGNPTYAELIWHALSFNPERYQQIRHQREQLMEQQKEKSWQDKGRALWEQL